MEWWTTIAGLVRRRRVIVPVVITAAIIGILAFFLTPVRYVSTATMVLTTTEFGGTQSQDPARPTELTNPMLNFNDSLKTTSAILIEAMNTKPVATELGADGPDRLVVDDGRTNPNLLGLNGPFLYIVGRSTSPDEAERIVSSAQQLMREKLRDWQSSLNAPAKTYVSLADVVPPSRPTTDRTRPLKAAAGGFVAGLVLGLGIAYLRQRLRSRGPDARDTTTAPRVPRWLVVSDRAPEDPGPTDKAAVGAVGVDRDRAGAEEQPVPNSLTARSVKS